ncbi:unnamed protein product [Anisakis simplex]|uniref:Galectin n=1 Tax=Anisakis simplex TaxID=6269 RepID=A0A0M3J821_ANISI|nr:unnamed protein product [Anisakis simplex]
MSAYELDLSFTNRLPWNIQLECAEPGHRMKEHATVTIAGLYGDMRPVVARFKRPTRISPNVPHRASIQFKEDVETYAGANGAEDIRVHIGQGGVGGAQETSSGADGDMFAAAAATDPSSIVHFAFHNDDPNGIRRGMTRGPAVFTNAIGGFYNRPQQYRPVPSISEGCLYEGQIPEIHFLAPALPKPEVAAATTTTTIKTD